MLTVKLTAVVAESQITEDDILNMESNVECLDKYTETILKKIPEIVLKASNEITTSDQVPPPTLEKQKESCLKILPIGKYNMKILPKDDYYGPVSMRDKAFLKGLSSTWIFPIKDKFLEIPEHLVEKWQDTHMKFTI